MSSKEGVLACKKVRERINDIASSFTEGGMKTVVVSIYPKYSIAENSNEAILIQSFSMVAFKDEIDYE